MKSRWLLLVLVPLLMNCRAERKCGTCPDDQICKENVCVVPSYPIARPLAYTPVTSKDKTLNTLVNGYQIRTAGTSLLLGTFPTHVVMNPAGDLLAVNENGYGSIPDPTHPDDKRQFLRTVDPATLKILQEIEMPHGNMSYGLRFANQGATLYVASGPDRAIYEYTVAQKMLTYAGAITTPDCFVEDIALDAKEARIFASCLLDSKVDVIDAGTRKVLARWDAGRFPYTLLPLGNQLWVSNWATEFKPEGDTLTILDSASGASKAVVTVGKGPEGLVASAGKVYSVGSKSDDVTEVNATSHQVERVISLHEKPDALKGIEPIHGVVSPDGKRLYVATKGDNTVEVVDLASGEVVGRIPTEWYASDVLLDPQGQFLYVVTSKGQGDGPSSGGEEVGRVLRGSLLRIPVPSDDDLPGMTRSVVENNSRQSFYFDFSRGNDGPIPSKLGHGTSPIKHVFVVMKENMSYDAIYGDMEVGNGDPNLVIWPKEITPNQHKLAREFSLLDGFYCDGESSWAGHQWFAAAIDPDFMEKGWRDSYDGRSPEETLPGYHVGNATQSELLGPHLMNHDVTLRSYGGIENFGPAHLSEFLRVTNQAYPFWDDFGVSDKERAEIFLKDFKGQLAKGEVPGFTYIFLPRNHGAGIAKGRETPASMVADNDEALGMVVDAISHSAVWRDSAIFVLEDDSQSGFDHVDTHRCAAMVIGPRVRRHNVSSVTYSIPNFHKTIEMILGVPPMTRYDEAASAMYDLFIANPVTTPYDKIPRTHPYEVYSGPENDLTKLSRKIDWSEIDTSPDTAALYYRYRKGTAPPATLKLPTEREDD
jgi:YVTN family beta-propeller protein